VSFLEITQHHISIGEMCQRRLGHVPSKTAHGVAELRHGVDASQGRSLDSSSACKHLHVPCHTWPRDDSCKPLGYNRQRWWSCHKCSEPIETNWALFHPSRCKTSSDGQSAEMSMPRSSVRFQQKLKTPWTQICVYLSYIDPKARVLNYRFK